MPRSRLRFHAALLPTPALGLFLSLLAWTAEAGPADLVLEVLDDPGFGASVDYDSVVDTGDGGVEIRGLSLTREALRELGAVGSFAEEPAPPAEPQAAVLVIETVRLDAGAIDVLFGVQGDAAADTIAFRLDGVRLDLAALADAPGPALLRQYLGGMDALTGSIEVQMRAAEPAYDVAAVFDLASVGRFEMDIAVADEGGPPSGTITLSDTAGRALVGLMALAQRVPVEVALEMTQSTLRDMREHPSNNPAAEDPIFDLLEGEVAAAEAILARFPQDGPAAAAAMAAWAEEMAVALPQHSAFFAAIHGFANTSGTLRLQFAPAEDSQIAMGAAFAMEFYADAEAFEAVLEALGVTAEFDPAD